ncbi:MAG: RnfABCDGE type electron transport complex subunit B [Pseudomonadaceae bacterium]|nr:RnfABCDGE type electron transport complex subunit B [Pseudomonadaceae bacterium]
MFAVIDEALCIGCTKCQQVCPSGAIVGARRMMHTIMADNCHACGDCLPVCPAACIAWNDGTVLVQAVPAKTTEGPTAVVPAAPVLPAEVLAKVAAARAASRRRYEAKGPLNTPKVLRTKRADSHAKKG